MRRIRSLSFIFLFHVSLSPQSVAAATYEIGPGKPFANIEDAPWESMASGDTVLISYRSQPYRSKFVIAVQGTQTNPFIVRGVPGPQGELPVIDGQDAVTRSALNYWNENRGVIKIGGANSPAVSSPSWILVENLDVRSGRPPFTFMGRNGVTSYISNAASFYVESGANITIRNCKIHDSGNGLFVSSASSNVLVQANDLFDNGIEGSIYEHNSYTEALGITFEYNHYAPLRTNCPGNNLKDRSAGLVVRYNWIQGGNRQLDLVESDFSTLISSPSYRKTFVYGNVLIEPDGAGNSQIAHYGGDGGDTAKYRKGTLHFYNNTVVSTRSGNTTLFRLSTNDETADARNNVFFTSAPGGNLAMLDGMGVLHLRTNWSKPGWSNSHSGLTGQVIQDAAMVTGSDPGFANLAGEDFRLVAGSACRDAGSTLSADAIPSNDVTDEYVKHLQHTGRVVAVPLDIGAFEYRAADTLAPQAPTNLRTIP